MSNAHLDAVFANRDPNLTGGDRLVMLVLANRANGDGICFPSRNRIADEAGMSVRQVQRIIPKLIEAGYIELLEAGNGRTNVAHYRVLIKGDTVSPLPQEKRETPEAEKGDTVSQKGRHPDTKGDTVSKKGDISSHTREEPNEPTLEPKEEPEVREPVRETAGLPVTLPSRSRSPRNNSRMVLDVRKFGADGYIPRGEGVTPVEVFHEFVSGRTYPLTRSIRDRLMETVHDLDKWRWTLDNCALRGFRPNNLQDRLDVYLNGFSDGASYENGGTKNGNGFAGKPTKQERNKAVFQDLRAMMQEAEWIPSA